MWGRLVRFLKEWTLPVAIAVGVAAYLCFTRVSVLHPAAEVLTPWVERLFPFNVFLILWATFCKVDFRRLRPARWALPVTLVQLMGGGVCLVAALCATGGWQMVAAGGMACFIAPCATASPVVTGKLGGDVSSMTAYVLVSSLLSTLLIPVCATLLAGDGGGGAAAMVRVGWDVLLRVGSVLTLPLLLGWAVRRYVGLVYRWVARHSDLPFYLWCVALATTSGITVRAIDHAGLPALMLVALAAVALAVCLVQFAAGRRIGTRYGCRVEGGQALGQKNTALIIWAATAFLNPVTALAPGCYVLWQNLVNSWQIHRKARASRL
ncbi:MAG: transporter [Bacteroidaceae bacterium]|nr:transporter [Bacteroidaceae bacterium]